MTTETRALCAAALLTVACATGAIAADPLATPGTDAILTLGAGGRVQPGFDGASTYILSPMPIVSLKFLRSPFSGEPTSDTGFGLYPSFRFIDRRPGSGKLTGLDPVDRTIQAGLGFDYTDTYWRAFVEIRQGFGGSNGQVADLGLDGIFRPMSQLKLSVGPRLSLATADYMRTYFGVTAAESAASGAKFSAYTPSGGIRGVGIGSEAVYDIDPHWQLRADAGWTRLVGDAAASPIVKKAGSPDQFTVGIGVAYRFGFGWH